MRLDKGCAHSTYLSIYLNFNAKDMPAINLGELSIIIM